MGVADFVVMSAEPSAAELASFATVLLVADWCSLQGALEDLTSPRGSFFALLGAVAGDSPRIVGCKSEPEFEAAVVAWRLGAESQTAPTLIQFARGAAGDVAQIASEGILVILAVFVL